MRKNLLKNKWLIGGILFVLIVLFCCGAAYYSFHQHKTDLPLEDRVSQALEEFNAGSQDAATKAFEKLVEENSDNDGLKLQLANCYYRSGSTDKFINFVQQNNLDSGTIDNMLATIYLNRGDNEKVEEYYKKAINADPSRTATYINFAAYYQGRGMLADALSVIESGISNNPHSASLLANAASISLKLSDKAKALDYANRTLVLEPENSVAQAVINSI